MNYRKISRQFRQIGYVLAIPDHSSPTLRPYRILISQHGTRHDAGDRGGDVYVQYPCDHDDPFWYDLVVVSPDFPPVDQNAPAPDGGNFQSFTGPGLTWIHDLIHTELPTVFTSFLFLKEAGMKSLNVDTSKVYFFGQSLGGMAVHTYIMKFNGDDIYRAASCAGRLSQRDGFGSLTDQQYLDKLDSFLSTNVASVIGTNDSAARIESIRSFICREVSQRVSVNDVNLVSPIPPVSLGDTATKLTCDLFTAPTITQRTPLLTPMLYRFRWNSGIGHWGRGNYMEARLYLFQGRSRRRFKLTMLLTDPALVLRRWFGLRIDKRLKLKEELEELRDLDLPIPDPNPPDPPQR